MLRKAHTGRVWERAWGGMRLRFAVPVEVVGVVLLLQLMFWQGAISGREMLVCYLCILVLLFVASALTRAEGR